jgi:hypothetical protein
MDWTFASADEYWARLGTPDEQRSWVTDLLEGRPDLQARLA